MRTIEDLRHTLDRHAGHSPDLHGMVSQAQAGATRIRRRRRIVTVTGAAFALTAVLVGTPIALRPQSAEPAPAAPTYHREHHEYTLINPAENAACRNGNASSPSPGPSCPELSFSVHGFGTDGGQQFMELAPRPQDVVGSIIVHDPGTFDPAVLLGGRPVTAAGHTAHLAEVPPSPDNAEPRFVLGWRDPSGAWVTVRGPDEEPLYRMAELVRLGPPRVAKVPVQLGWTPDGLRVSHVSGPGDRGTTPEFLVGLGGKVRRQGDPASTLTHGKDMYLRIAPVTTYEWTRLTALVADRWQAKDAYRTAELTAEQTTKAFDEEGGRTLLVEAGTCGMAVHVAASAEVTPADVDRMVADLRIADCTDPATWPPVTR